MSEGDTRVTGWGTIIAVMVAVGVGTGLLLGLMGEAFGLTRAWTTGCVGAAIGGAGAVMIGRRRAALDRQNKSQGK